MSAVEVQASKTVEPLFVKVQNGVTHIVARVGDVLLYIETTASGLAKDTKAWVIGTADVARKRFVGVMEPAQASLARAVDVSITRAVGAASFAKCKTMEVVVPVQVRIEQGVVYVHTRIANIYVAFSAKASNTWSNAVVYYTRSYSAVTARVEAISQRGRDIVSKTRLSTYNAVEPTLMKAQDGCLYVQTSIGNVVVRIKVGVLAQQSRLAAIAHRVSSNIYQTVDGLTAPVVERILAIYEQARTRLVTACGPYLQMLDGFRTTLTTQVNGVAVALKVRTATGRELAMRYPSMCYVKVKGGCVYLYEFVGDKVVGIKVQLDDILAKLNAALVKLNSDIQTKFGAVESSVRSRALVVADGVKHAASDRRMQATAAGSISGSAALAASGGATGLATGTMVGAACGLIPAVFTFGLSIRGAGDIVATSPLVDRVVTSPSYAVYLMRPGRRDATAMPSLGGHQKLRARLKTVLLQTRGRCRFPAVPNQLYAGEAECGTFVAYDTCFARCLDWIWSSGFES